MFLFMCLWSIGMMAADGDVFTVKVGEYDMTFRVMSEADKTVQTGAVLEWSSGINYNSARCISGSVSGTLSIPAVVSREGVDYRVVRIGVSSFYCLKDLEAVIIPEGVESIGRDAFSNYELDALALSQVTLPSTLRVIENSAFSQIGGALGEGNFKSIVIPEGVERIEAAAFSNNFLLESADLPSTLQFLGENAFGATVLTSVTIPAATTEIEGRPFAFIQGLTSLTVEADNPVYDSRGNCNAIIETATNTLQEGTVSTVIPSSVRIIGESAFSSLKLGELNVPEGVERVEEYAFYKCGISALSLPHSLRYIGRSAFYSNPLLTTMVIPEGVEIIEDYAFSSGYKRVELPSTLKFLGSCFEGNDLEDVYVASPIPCEVSGSTNGSYPFYPDGLGFAATLHVPAGSRAIYESSLGFDHFPVVVEAGMEDLTTFTANIDGVEMSFRVLDEDAATVQIGVGKKEVNCLNMDANDYETEDDRWGTELGVDIPSSVTNPSTGKTYRVTAIGEYAFYRIIPRKELVIPEGVTTIYKSAFETHDYTKHITSLKLPESLETICSNAFYCAEISQVNIPQNLKAIGNRALSSLAVFKYLNTLSFDISELRLPEGMTQIGQESFASAAIKHVVLPADMKVVPQGMFSSAFVESIDLPEGLEKTKKLSLYAWINSKSITLPASLKEIETQSFDLYSLNSIITLPTTPPAVENGELVVQTDIDYNGITLYVPVGAKSAYQTAPGWNKFTNIVEMVGKETISIGNAEQVAYYCDKHLNFTDVEGLKAYVATGYDKSTGTIWLSRVYDVPARTGFLLVGGQGNHEIPVSYNGSSSYYKNMFKGTLEGTTIQTTDGAYTNYYLSSGDEGVGFYKVTKEGGVTLSANRAYLPIPTVIEAVGEAGSLVAISVGGAEQVPYYSDQSLDFTSMEAQGMKAYTATGYDYATGTIWLSRVKQVPAETGVLIMAPKGDYEVPTVSVASVYENMFKGTLGGTTIFTEEDGFINYYLSNGKDGVGFYKVTKEEGVALGKNRCYLQIPKVRPASSSRGGDASQISADLNSYGIGTSETIGIQLLGSTGGNGEGTTNIRESVNTVGEPDVYYNLNGQRVDNPTKGLYIQNGKKVIVR